MADRSLVDFGVIEEKLNVSHLNKDTQNIVRNIERNRKEGFARKGKRVGSYTRFIYDLPVELTLFHAGGGIYAPPTTFRQFSPRRTYPRRLQVYSKFKFCNFQTFETGFRSKNFSMAQGRLPKWVGN